MKVKNCTANIFRIVLLTFLIYIISHTAFALPCDPVYLDTALRTTLSPALQIDDDIRWKFQFGYWKYQQIRTLIQLTVETLEQVQGHYETGIPAFVRGTFGDLILRVLALQRQSLNAWKLNVLYDLHPFIWEYEKTGRTAKTDELFNKIIAGVERLYWEKLPRISESKIKYELQVVERMLLSGFPICTKGVLVEIALLHPLLFGLSDTEMPQTNELSSSVISELRKLSLGQMQTIYKQIYYQRLDLIQNAI